MNISPSKYKELMDDIKALKFQVAGLISVVSESQTRKHERDPSINGFCERHGICRATFKNLRKRGIAPRETLVSPNRIIITEEDEAAWVAARQAEMLERPAQRGRKPFYAGEVA